MRKSTNHWKVTMVNLEQLKKRRYTTFKTPKALKQFCSRYHVNAFWWKPPQGSKKIFMIDEQNFRSCYNKVHFEKSPRSTTRSTSNHKSTNFNRKPTNSTWKKGTKPVRLSTGKKTYSTRSSSTRKSYRRAA